MPVAVRKRPDDGIHVVAAGETISSIAAQYGFTEWESRIYDAPQNAQLKLARPNPNTLVPGDQVFIPELMEKVEPRPTDAWHDFHVTGNKRFLRLRLQNADDTAIANEPYRIEPRSQFRGRFVQQGQTTSAEGIIEEQIPHNMIEAELLLPKLNMSIRLQVGHLLPIPMGEPVKGIADLAGDLLSDPVGALGDVAGDVGGSLTGALDVEIGANGVSGGADLAASANALAKAGATVTSAVGAVAGVLGDGSFGNETDPNIYSAAQRLKSMGFHPGEPRDNRRTPSFTAALMAFQTWCKEQGTLADGAGGVLGEMTAPGGVLGGGGGPMGAIAAGVAGPMLAAVGLTGQLDEETIEALKTTHGC